MAKRKTKRQKAAAEAQRIRMQKYWAEKKAKDAKEGAVKSRFIDQMNAVRPILEKVYQAGWNQDKSREVHPVYGYLSVDQAYKRIEEIFKP